MIDLHLHLIPAVDDGSRSNEESHAMIEGLCDLGFQTLITTPHIRQGMFDNTTSGLKSAFSTFCLEMPDALATRLNPSKNFHLACEHFWDESILARIPTKDFLYYPSGKHALFEFQPRQWPFKFDEVLFRMQVSGTQMVLAHPERYDRVAEDHAVLNTLREKGVRMLLDVMSLVGHYGKRSEAVSKRLLELQLYDGACTDLHQPSQLDVCQHAIDTLERLVGKSAKEALFLTLGKELLGNPDVVI